MRSLLPVAALACTAALIAGCGESSSTGTTTTVPTTRVGATRVAPCGPFETRTASQIMIQPHSMECHDARPVILGYIGRRAAPEGWQCAPATLTARSTSGSCQALAGPGAANARWRLTTE